MRHALHQLICRYFWSINKLRPKIEPKTNYFIVYDLSDLDETHVRQNSFRKPFKSLVKHGSLPARRATWDEQSQKLCFSLYPWAFSAVRKFYDFYPRGD